MREWTLVGTAVVPGSETTLTLHQSSHDFVIRLAGSGTELMSTRRRGSEEALGRLPFAHIPNPENAKVLIGGLGMGFTLAAALHAAGRDACVTVAELVPEVVEWNRGPLGDKSGSPLKDPRIRLHIGDVTSLLRERTSNYDIIALDIDNGPEGLTSAENDWLYSQPGIATTRRALRPGGVIAYWSATSDPRFAKRLRDTGDKIFEERVHAHGKKGTRHTIWMVKTENPGNTKSQGA
jgi:spermidine synthase